MNMDYDLFMEEIKRTARAEIEGAGYEQLRTPEEVEEAFARPGTTLVMVNSVCGCAGGIARPAAANAIHYDKRPDHLVTVFAGQDKEATAKMREYFGDIPPSSPSMALLDGKEVVQFIPREQIEGRSLEEIVNDLLTHFDNHC